MAVQQVKSMEEVTTADDDGCVKASESECEIERKIFGFGFRSETWDVFFFGGIGNWRMECANRVTGVDDDKCGKVVSLKGKTEELMTFWEKMAENWD